VIPAGARNARGLLALVAYALTIPAANWSIGHVGRCLPDGPCVVGVGLGLVAPSGVLWVGVTLFLRDLVQEALGRRWTVAGILAGAALSALVAPRPIAVASGAAFLLSEAADFLVFQPLRRRSRPLAVLASGVVGGLVDSAVFLGLAFGSLEFLVGQWLGKSEMTLLCALLLWAWREWGRRRPAEGGWRPTGA
jgi:uncharacterized PurR-regulated membrane protein YhhQ (DUF165 family)